MADIFIDVEVRGNEKVINAVKNIQSLESKVKTLSNAFSRGAISQRQYYKGINQLATDSNKSAKELRDFANSVRKSEREMKKAAAAAKAEQQAIREYAQARRQATEENRRFDATLVKNAQEFKRLKASIDPAYAAQQRLLSVKKTLRAQIKSNNITMEEAIALMKRYRQASLAGAVGATGYGRSMNRAGVLTQQAGYQIGDFLVQVQSGTNAFVAFGQQATQVAGTLTLLGGKWVFLGSALGVAIPLLTAVGAAIMRTSTQSKSFSEQLDELNSTIDEYKTTVEDANKSTEEMLDTFGNFSGRIKPLLDDLRELSRIEAMNALQTQFEDLNIVTKSWVDTIKDVLGVTNATTRYREELGLTADQYQRMGQLVKELRAAESYAERLQKSRELRDLIEESAGSVDNMTDRMRAFYESLLKVVVAGGELEQVSGKTKTNVIDLAFAAEDVVSAVSSIDFSNAIAGATTLVDKLRAAATNAWSMAQARASVESGQTQRAFDMAAYSQGQTAMRQAEAKARGEMYGVTVGDGLTTFDVPNILPPGKPRGSSGRSGGGGGASQIESMQEAFGKLMDRLNGVDPLITKFNEEVAKLKEWQEAGAISMDQYTKAVSLLKKELIAAQDPLVDFRKKLEDALDDGKNYAKSMEALNGALADFLFDPFEKGVKGMVLQFSDALRRMASEAIAAQIMKSIIGPVGGGGGLFGGIFGFSQGGVTPFASGGVVNSPSLFPMSGGRTGLMGEAGPEAIMPLKRGSNGKLGVQMEQPKQPPQETTVKVINIDDRESIGKYLNSPSGEKVVLNVLRKNGVAV